MLLSTHNIKHWWPVLLQTSQWHKEKYQSVTEIGISYWYTYKHTQSSGDDYATSDPKLEDIFDHTLYKLEVGDYSEFLCVSPKTSRQDVNIIKIWS